MASGDLEIARTVQLDRVLMVLASCGGSERLAAKKLRQSKDDPLRITAPQLAAVRNDNERRYQELFERYRNEIEAGAIRSITEAMTGAFAGAVMAVDQARDKLEAGDVKDPGKLGRDLAVTGAILADKLLVLTNRPNQIREKRNVDDILKDIARQIQHDIDGSAEEIAAPGLPEGGTDGDDE